MEVFLPIAQVFVNPIEILLLSAIVGVLSGLFGVGGGFLMTPFLIFLGIPPAYAVANEANNILATSVSGSTTHWLKNTLDYKMGFMIVIGGSIGTALGIYTFSYFKGIGKIDTVISLAYMYILAIIGTLMLVESLGEIDKAKKKLSHTNVTYVNAKAERLPFENNEFDFILCAFGLRNFFDINAALLQIHRTLKPEGKFICLEFSQVNRKLFRIGFELYCKIIPRLGQFLQKIKLHMII